MDFTQKIIILYNSGKYYYDDPINKRNGEFDIVTLDDKGCLLYTSGQSQHKDGAWQFIKSLFDDAYQKSCFYFPVMRSSFDDEMCIRDRLYRE